MVYTAPTLTRYITEGYSDFTEETLLGKPPVKNWPSLLGCKAAAFINEQYKDAPVKVYVAYGGVGRTTLEVFSGCENINIVHTDTKNEQLEVFQNLLKTSQIQWTQQVEGSIVQPMSFSLDEAKKTLLTSKKSSVSFKPVENYTSSLSEEESSYDVVITDFRHKNTSAEIAKIASSLKDGGFLILGSIDDIRVGEWGEEHSLSSLKRYFEQVNSFAVVEVPHIFKETANKHQYAVSYLSVWTRINRDTSNEATLKNTEIIPSSSEVSTTEQYYEDEHILSSYERFHFGDGLLSVKNFPLRMSEVILEACQKFQCNMDAALDAGCGPGRTAIELCKAFKKVEGYDYSQGFIDMLVKYKEKEKLTNLTCYQGDSHKQQEICVEKKFDMIFGCNLIDRLHTPQDWLKQSKEMLNKNGLLVISSPYTWKPEHTNISKWIGGFIRNGENIHTVEGLKQILAPELVLLEERKVPFVIPDADGTYQYTYSNCTVFGNAR